MKDKSAGRPSTSAELFWFGIQRTLRILFQPVRRLRQWLCGIIFKHRPLSSDSGYLIGSKMVDRWCALCGKMVQVPMAEDPRYDDSSKRGN